MIRIEADVNITKANFNELTLRLGNRIKQDEEIKKIIKSAYKSNINRQKMSDDSIYRKRELRSGKKYWMSNLPHKPIEPIKHIIDRSKIIGNYDFYKNEISFNFRLSKKDARKYLIHNFGGITYNPRSKDKRSIIPEREYLYLNRYYKNKLLNEIRKYGIT